MEALALSKADFRDPASRIRRLVRGAEARLRTVALRAIREAGDSLPALEELARLIEAGRVDDAIRTAARVLAGRVADESAAAFLNAGTETAGAIERGFEVVVGFDVASNRSVQYMRSARLDLIREFTTEQRGATRDALVEGVALGENPREQARAFRQSIGLTRRQRAAVANYRRLLMRAAAGDTEALTRRLRDRRFDSTVQAAARMREPLTPDQVNRMVARYRERYLKYRSETIARTEAMASVHAGTDEAYMQAVDRGAFRAGEVRRVWSTSIDGRERESHALADGQEVGLTERFLVGGAIMRYPGDRSAPAREVINCRCAVYTRVLDRGAAVQTP